MPKISVIVPVYNAEKHLKKCLESIINQTYKAIEIIIVNDGSTDNSEGIILEYKKQYPERIQYFKRENNGVAETRNFGIKNINGEYFIFVDSDDYIENCLIENLVKNVINENIDIVKYKMIIERETEVEKINGPIFEIKNGEEAFNELCFKDVLIDTPCLYLFNTQFYKKNNFKFLNNTYHEDFGLIPLVIIKADKVKSLNLYGYKYVQVENSIIRNESYKKTVKKATDLLVHYDNMINEIKNISLKKKTIINLKQYYTNAILNRIKELKKNEKKEYIKEIKKRNLIKNIKINNLKKLIKKIVIRMKYGI